jgi:hypothetical protein
MANPPQLNVPAQSFISVILIAILSLGEVESYTENGFFTLLGVEVNTNLTASVCHKHLFTVTSLCGEFSI